jgi:HK97 family phage major capsid protein
MTTMRDLRDLTAAHEANQRARDFSRLIYAHGLAAVEGQPVQAIVEHMPGFERLRTKAAVAGGTTSNLGELAGDISAREFLNLLSKRTVLGRLMGTLSAPPNTKIPTPATDPVPYWVSEGKPLPLALMSFTDPTTGAGKYGILQAFSRELFRVADERAVSLIERIAQRALVRAEDTLLLSDTAADGTAPAGLLAGLSPIGGGSPASIADVEELWTAVSGGDAMMPYFVVSPRGAMHLAARNIDGEPVFPNISPAIGGDIAGVPVLLSKAAANRLILIDAASLAVVDLGLEVGRSQQTSIQMLDNPTNNAATGTGTTLVSAFQSNMIVLRFLRWLHWLKLLDDAVAYLELPISGSPA